MRLVGQKRLKEEISGLVLRSYKFPQFITIANEAGSGKMQVAKYIAQLMDKPLYEFDNKVDSIREMISSAKQFPGFYVVRHGEQMSGNAQNALLKLVEEPPVNTYFILTTRDESKLLPTIKSRAYALHMDDYSSNDLQEYRPGLSEKYYRIATTPGFLDTLVEYGDDFINYVETVCEYLPQVEPANAFKSGNKLALKGDTGYDLSIFFQTALMYYLNTNLLYSLITAQYCTDACRAGVNKQQLFDMWVLEIRGAKS